MPILTQGQINEIKAAFLLRFEAAGQALSKSAENWGDALFVRETTDSETYDIFEILDQSKLRKTKVGAQSEYSTKGARKHVITIDQHDHSVSLELKDLTKMIGSALKQGVSGANLYAMLNQQITCDVLRDGDSSAYVMPHGSNFFDDSIPAGGTTFDNLLALPFTLANLATAIGLMQFFSAHNGEPAGFKPNHLIVPPALYKDALDYTQSTYLERSGDGGDNQTTKLGHQGQLKPLSDVRLIDPNDWFLLHASEYAKPIMIVTHDTYGTPEYVWSSQKETWDNKRLEATSFVWLTAYGNDSRTAIKSVQA